MHRIFTTSVASVYPHYVTKAEKKGRTQAEVDEVIRWLTGFDHVTPDHVQAMALPVLRHRLQLRPEAELEGVDADGIVRSVLQQVRVPL